METAFHDELAGGRGEQLTPRRVGAGILVALDDRWACRFVHPLVHEVVLSMVPGAGFEPALPFEKGGLSPPRLPIPPPGLGAGWRRARR